MLFVKKTRGFTLVELLVAAVILISTISLSQIAFSQYSRQISKRMSDADKYIAIMQAKNLIDLNDDLDKLDGEYTYNEIAIVWHGKIIDQFRVAKLEPDEGGMKEKNVTFYLIEYQLTLKKNGLLSNIQDLYVNIISQKDLAPVYEE